MPRKPSSSLRSSSDLEAALFFQIRAAGLPVPVQQYRFAPPRKYRADFCWPASEHRLIVEVQGGIWIAGRHNRASGYEADLERANLATLQGWRLLQFTAGMIESGVALGMIEQALKKCP